MFTRPFNQLFNLINQQENRLSISVVQDSRTIALATMWVSVLTSNARTRDVKLEVLNSKYTRPLTDFAAYSSPYSTEEMLSGRIT